MKLVDLIESLRRRLPALARVCLAVLALLVVLDAIPAIVDKEHAHTKLERLPAFWALFGLLGAFALIIVSKALGHLGIKRREDYYDE